MTTVRVFNASVPHCLCDGHTHTCSPPPCARTPTHTHTTHTRAPATLLRLHLAHRATHLAHTPASVVFLMITTGCRFGFACSFCLQGACLYDEEQKLIGFFSYNAVPDYARHVRGSIELHCTFLPSHQLGRVSGRASAGMVAIGGAKRRPKAARPNVNRG